MCYHLTTRSEIHQCELGQQAGYFAQDILIQDRNAYEDFSRGICAGWGFGNLSGVGDKISITRRYRDRGYTG